LRTVHVCLERRGHAPKGYQPRVPLARALVMRNAPDGTGELMSITVVRADSKEIPYQKVKSFSCDAKGCLHVHKDDGPIALYGPQGWLAVEVHDA
jgi:hypothetical protein